MSRQNKKTLFIVFMLAIFVVCIYGLTATQDTISLREYVDIRFAEMQRAVDKAFAANESKLVGMNEIRGSLNDAQKLFATKAEMIATVDPMKSDIRELRSIADEAKGKASQTSLLITSLIAILALAMNVSRCLSDKKKK